MTPQNPTPRPPGLMPPIWSWVFVTLATILCVGGLAAAFLAIGGQTPPAQPIQLTIWTAAPDVLLTNPLGPRIDLPATSPGQSNSGQVFVMQGPTLPAVVFTATPEQIAIGKTVEVVDVGDQQLNVRTGPGIVDVDISFRAPEGSRFIVVDGPSQADGLTWWRIDDPSSNRSGWAASNYLVPVSTE